MYKCYNKEVHLELNSYQEETLNKLLTGDLSKVQLANMRSNARRSKNLQRSIDLAVVFEIYKFEMQYAEEREEQSSG